MTRVDSANARFPLPASAEVFEAALEGLTRVNQLLLRTNATPIPPLYQSGVRYRRERDDVWKHCLDVIRDGWGDCEDLACWRAAELRQSGKPARVRVYKSAPHLWHVVVQIGDSNVCEDPSRMLGMKGGESPMRRNYIGADDSKSDEITISASRKGNAVQVIARIPLDFGRAFFIHRDGSTEKDATNVALKAASTLLKNPRVKDLIPAPARFALELASSKKAQSIAKGLLSKLNPF